MKVKAADHARARFTEPMGTDALKVTGARAAVTAIKASTNYGAATDVQAATVAWDTETTNLDTGLKLVADLEKKLAVARGDLLATQRRWGLRRAATLSAIDTFCDGSKDKVLSFAAVVAGISGHVAPSVPVGLQNWRSKTPGVAGVEWHLTPKNRAGFMVQHCTNPADPATWSAPIACTKRSFRLADQTPGATIQFRVLALDPTLPTGQTGWTAWVAAPATA